MNNYIQGKKYKSAHIKQKVLVRLIVVFLFVAAFLIDYSIYL